MTAITAALPLSHLPQLSAGPDMTYGQSHCKQSRCICRCPHPRGTLWSMSSGRHDALPPHSHWLQAPLHPPTIEETVSFFFFLLGTLTRFPYSADTFYYKYIHTPCSNLFGQKLLIYSAPTLYHCIFGIGLPVIIAVNVAGWPGSTHRSSAATWMEGGAGQGFRSVSKSYLLAEVRPYYSNDKNTICNFLH